MIDGFQLKESKKDPDITLEDSNVYMKTFDQPSALMKGIILIIMGLMIFQMIGGIK